MFSYNYYKEIVKILKIEYMYIEDVLSKRC